MAALAYVLLPLSGLIAFLVGSSARVRFHGLQAIALGSVWALAAYAASAIAPVVTAAVFAVGALTWAALMIGALMGRDLRLPGARFLEGIAAGAAGNGSSTDAS